MNLLILNEFRVFAIHLNKWFIEHKMFDYYRCWVILDNCTSHRAKIVTQFFLNTNSKIYYLPPYSPQFVPVEIAFGIIKKKFIFACSNQIVDCKKNEMLIKLLILLKKLTRNTWVEIFRKVLFRYIDQMQCIFEHVL